MGKAKPDDIFTELVKTVEAIGVDGTANALKNARVEQLNLADKNVEFIVSLTTTTFKMTFEDIVDSRTKVGHRVHAMKIMCFYLNNFGYSIVDIAALIKRDKGLVSRYCKEVAQSKSKSDTPHFYHKIFKSFDIAIAQFKLHKK
jgi:hypothetical protein